MSGRFYGSQDVLTVLTTRIPTMIFTEQVEPYINSQKRRASWQLVSLDALMLLLERDPLLLPRHPYRFSKDSSTVQTTRIPVWLRDEKIVPFLRERQAADMPATQQWLVVESISQIMGIDFSGAVTPARRPRSTVWSSRNVIRT